MKTHGLDDQPISAGFFNEGDWLTSWITPNALEVQRLFENITKGIKTPEDRIIACWDWVAGQVKYKSFISASITVEGQTSKQTDYWQKPSQCIHTHIGNCVNKAVLVTSLIRNELPPDQIKCVLGNLYNGKPGGHSWAQVSLGGDDYIVETTRYDVQPLVLVSKATRYEPVHFFNDEMIEYVEGKTQVEPYAHCASVWLSDYLDFAYIQGRK